MNEETRQIYLINFLFLLRWKLEHFYIENLVINFIMGHRWKLLLESFDATKDLVHQFPFDLNPNPTLSIIVYENFFFLTLLPNFFLSLTSFEKKFPKWPTFILGVFFFVVFLIPAVSNRGNEPLPDTCQSVTGWRDWTFFFKIFFSFPPFQLAGLTFYFYFSFFYFFGTTYIYN